MEEPDKPAATPRPPADHPPDKAKHLHRNPGGGSGLSKEPRTMDRHREGYVLTTEPGRVEIDRVHAWLAQETYWAKGRDRG